MKTKSGQTNNRSFAVLAIAILISCVISAAVCPSAQADVGWSKAYGGANADGVRSIVYPVVIQTSDGGFLVTGDTRSYGAGSNDAYVVKTDANGDIQWNKTYGGPLNESACGVLENSGGGYTIFAATNSYGGGGNDFWLLKTDANGNLQWNRTYGGTGDDSGGYVFQTADGGFVLIGQTNSFGAGGYDVWVIKTDTAGNMQWNKTYGAAALPWSAQNMKQARSCLLWAELHRCSGFQFTVIPKNNNSSVLRKCRHILV